VIVWDFDGTLARRHGGTSFAACMVETLDAHEPGHAVTVDRVRPFLRSGFPWHSPAIAHCELETPDMWWGRVEPLLARAYEGVGYPADRAGELGALARRNYVDTRYWELFEDTIPVLAALSERGWRHLVLSNHVPELDAIVAQLGLAPLLDAVVNSALTGYEKPHPEAFAIARRAAGEPSEIWMVGDNPKADVEGARAAGIPAILARSEAARELVEHHAATLHGVEAIVTGA
jgi:putative hydrolase of the HAD superfamily